jgi:hypothetical protein
MAQPQIKLTMPYAAAAAYVDVLASISVYLPSMEEQFEPEDYETVKECVEELRELLLTAAISAIEKTRRSR